MRKVLFYSTYHFNTESYGPYLELMQLHLNKGDEVHFLSCNSELSSCQVNPNHTLLKCLTCINIRKNGTKCLNGDVKEVTLSDFHQQVKIDPSSLPTTFNSTEELKKYYYKNFDLGMAVLSSIVSISRSPAPDLLKNQKLIRKQLESSVRVYETVLHLINQYKFESVYVFNARFATLRACLRACEFKKVNCFVLEQGKDYRYYSIFPNVMPHSIEFYTNEINRTWGEGEQEKIDAAINYYALRSQSKNDRVGFFTASQTKGKLPENWDAKNQNITIFTSSEDEFVAIGDEWKNELYLHQADAIERITKDFESSDDFHFFVRIHPNLTGLYNKSITDILEIKRNNLTIILPNDDISTYDLMKQANKIITFGSSVGIEAAAFQKISILAGKTFYMNLGSTYNPSNHDEVIQMIRNKTLKPKDPTGAYKYAYFLSIFGIPYKFFNRINTFEAEMNGQHFSTSILFNVIRKVGRWLRVTNEKRIKTINKKKVSSLFQEKQG